MRSIFSVDSFVLTPRELSLLLTEPRERTERADLILPRTDSGEYPANSWRMAGRQTPITPIHGSTELHMISGKSCPETLVTFWNDWYSCFRSLKLTWIIVIVGNSIVNYHATNSSHYNSDDKQSLVSQFILQASISCDIETYKEVVRKIPTTASLWLKGDFNFMTTGMGIKMTTTSLTKFKIAEARKNNLGLSVTEALAAKHSGIVTYQGINTFAIQGRNRSNRTALEYRSEKYSHPPRENICSHYVDSNSKRSRDKDTKVEC